MLINFYVLVFYEKIYETQKFGEMNTTSLQATIFETWGNCSLQKSLQYLAIVLCFQIKPTIKSNKIYYFIYLFILYSQLTKVDTNKTVFNVSYCQFCRKNIP